MITNKERKELSKYRKHYLTMQQNQQKLEYFRKLSEFIDDEQNSKYIKRKIKLS